MDNPIESPRYLLRITLRILFELGRYVDACDDGWIPELFDPLPVEE